MSRAIPSVDDFLNLNADGNEAEEETLLWITPSPSAPQAQPPPPMPECHLSDAQPMSPVLQAAGRQSVPTSSSSGLHLPPPRLSAPAAATLSRSSSRRSSLVRSPAAGTPSARSVPSPAASHVISPASDGTAARRGLTFTSPSRGSSNTAPSPSPPSSGVRSSPSRGSSSAAPSPSAPLTVIQSPPSPVPSARVASPPPLKVVVSPKADASTSTDNAVSSQELLRWDAENAVVSPEPRKPPPTPMRSSSRSRLSFGGRMLRGRRSQDIKEPTNNEVHRFGTPPALPPRPSLGATVRMSTPRRPPAIPSPVVSAPTAATPLHRTYSLPRASPGRAPRASIGGCGMQQSLARAASMSRACPSPRRLTSIPLLPPNSAADTDEMQPSARRTQSLRIAPPADDGRGPRVTIPKPFALQSHLRMEDRRRRKEEQRKAEEKDAEKRRLFKARPMPDFYGRRA